jgi:Flp pilus assembly protein TadG
MLGWLRFGDRRGHTSMIAAMCGSALMIMIGSAIDYGYALNINQRLNEAADTAVLSAISPAIAQGAGSYAIAYANGNMKTVAKNTFATNTSSLPISVTPNITITPTVNNNVSTYTATLSYSTSVPTFFAGIVGMSSIPISGHAQATTSPLTYIRYFILIDISQSMGIGATTADMSALYTRIANNGQGTGGEVGCVFGCHVAESTQTHSNEDYAHNAASYSKTGSYGADSGGYIMLRIDSANTAIDSIIQTAIKEENSQSPNISLGLYTMSAYPSATITPIFPTNQPTPTSSNQYTWQATTNLTPWKNVSVDLGPNVSNGLGDSDLIQQLASFAAYLPAQGTGASASSPLNYVFLVTDGLVDTYCTTGLYDHCTQALPSSACSALQSKATVGVIYTTYVPIMANTSDSSYQTRCGVYECTYYDFALPYVNSIPKNLQACATSSNYYFQASYGPDIVAAMQSLFTTSLETVRLTQ